MASYRAQETERPDALFRDPLAARLAGDRGKAMAGIGNRQMRSGWFLVMRTKLLDEQIEAAVAAGADLIVNLAAGLDTRPYRMNLPPTLRWVEADLPGMVKEKTRPWRSRSRAVIWPGSRWICPMRPCAARSFRTSPWGRGMRW
ncbi:MAG TPA: class I SAM-dependent methyltransferase [Opitutaceae bacterium]